MAQFFGSVFDRCCTGAMSHRPLSKVSEGGIQGPARSAAIFAVQHTEIGANPKDQQECEDPKHSP